MMKMTTYIYMYFNPPTSVLIVTHRVHSKAHTLEQKTGDWPHRREGTGDHLADQEEGQTHAAV